MDITTIILATYETVLSVVFGLLTIFLVTKTLNKSLLKSDSDNALEKLGNEFRTPGHIPVCREAEGGLSRRQGHTELAVGLARLSGMTPVVIGAEMLQANGDLALPMEDARIWARERGIPFLTGKELMNALGL